MAYSHMDHGGMDHGDMDHGAMCSMNVSHWHGPMHSYHEIC